MVPAATRADHPVVSGSEPLPWWATALLAAGTTAGFAAVVWSAAHLRVDPALRTAALLVHLVALVIGFGAVLVLDCYALLWWRGRRSSTQLTRVASATQLPIWLGLIGLVLSGALCQPNFASRLTWVKLGLVLLVMLNGLYAHAVGERLVRADAEAIPPGLLRHTGALVLVSQLGWCSAVIIGFVNTG